MDLSMLKFSGEIEASPLSIIYDFLPADMGSVKNWALVNKNFFHREVTTENSKYWLVKCQAEGLKENLMDISLAALNSKSTTLMQLYLKRLAEITIYIPIRQDLRPFNIHNTYNWNFVASERMLELADDGTLVKERRKHCYLLYFNKDELFADHSDAYGCYQVKVPLLAIHNNFQKMMSKALFCSLAFKPETILAYIEKTTNVSYANPLYIPKENSHSHCAIL